MRGRRDSSRVGNPSKDDEGRLIPSESIIGHNNVNTEY